MRVFRPDAVSPIVYPCFYEEDPRTGFRYRPNAEARVAGHFEIDNLARTNSLGFHDDEPLPPDGSAWRVLALGDSFTAGLNLQREEVWTAVLERELRARGFPTADVINLGLDGTGTDVQLDLVEDALARFRPHTVIVAFFANDALDVLNGRFRRECHRGFALSYQDDLQRLILRERVDDHLEHSVLRAAFERSYAVRLVLHALLGPLNLFRLNFVQPTAAELGIHEGVRETRRGRLSEVAARLDALPGRCDCRVIVAPVPARRSLLGSLRVLQRQLPTLAVPVVDVVPAIEGELEARGLRSEDLYWVHDAHLNATGNDLYGRALADALLAGPRP